MDNCAHFINCHLPDIFTYISDSNKIRLAGYIYSFEVPLLLL